MKKGRSISRFGFALLLLLVANTAGAAVETIGWYRMGEAGVPEASSSGSGPTLQRFGNVTSSSSFPSANNTPLATSSVSQEFDGASGSLATAQGVLVTSQADNIGLEAWVKSEDSSRTAIIVHSGMSSGSLGSRGFGLLQINGTYCGHLAGVAFVGGSPVQTGVWTHLALVRQDGVWQFYVNGVLSASSEVAQVPPSPAVDSFAIGSFPAQGSGFFLGQIDEVRVFIFSAGEFYSGDLNYFSAALPPWIQPFNWSAVPERSPGIRYTQVTITNPRRNVVSVLQVDLSNPDIRFATTGRHSLWGQPMPDYRSRTVRTRRQTTRDFLSTSRTAGMNMVVAVNAAPWLPWEFPYNHQYADDLGLAVSNGVLVSDQSNSPYSSPSFVFRKDWTAQIVASKSETVDVANVLTAVSGFDMILTRGTAAGSGADDTSPRTGFGLSLDRRKVILMTVDGRQNNYSLGVGTKEAGELLRYFGAWNGINMDGGGSTALALYNSVDNTVALANRPSGSERPTGNNFGIYYVSAPEPVPLTDWLQYRGVTSGLRGALDDPSGDGVSNLLAYLFNVHPMNGLQAGDINGSPTYTVTTSQNGEQFLEIAFRVNRHATGIDWGVETSQSLATGSWAVPVSLQLVNVGTDPLTKDALYRAKIPLAQAQRLFGRIKAQIPPP